MPEYQEETLKKMKVKSKIPGDPSLTEVCEKYNIRKGNLNNYIFSFLIFAI